MGFPWELGNVIELLTYKQTYTITAHNSKKRRKNPYYNKSYKKN